MFGALSEHFFRLRQICFSQAINCAAPVTPGRKLALQVHGLPQQFQISDGFDVDHTGTFVSVR